MSRQFRLIPSKFGVGDFRTCQLQILGTHRLASRRPNHVRYPQFRPVEGRLKFDPTVWPPRSGPYPLVSTKVSEKTGILAIACSEMRNLVPFWQAKASVAKTRHSVGAGARLKERSGHRFQQAARGQTASVSNLKP